MSIFAPLSIARQALLAQQRALQVTGQNIANVNTPGYSRQSVVLTSVPPEGDAVGGGVRAGAVLQAVDPFLEARRLASASTLAAATTSRDLLDRIQGTFPVQGAGIGTALQEFFAAANALATSPQDIGTRSDLLQKAETLASQLRASAASLASSQRDVDRQVVQTTRDANQLLTTIASLNANIHAAEVGGATANDLRDARREALLALAKSLDVHVVEQSDGTTNVYAASGVALVLGIDAARLTTVSGPSGAALDGGAVAQVAVQQDEAVIPLPRAHGGRAGDDRADRLRDPLRAARLRLRRQPRGGVHEPHSVPARISSSVAAHRRQQPHARRAVLGAAMILGRVTQSTLFRELT